MTSRRDFLRQGGALGAGAVGAAAMGAGAFAGLPNLLSAQPAPLDRAVEIFSSAADVKELMNAALNAATMAGASYGDVRLSRQRQNFVFTREQQIQNVVDTDTIGIGVRTLVDGTWGFAATTNVSPWTGLRPPHVNQSRLRRRPVLRATARVEWLPSPVFKDVKWKGAFTVDPWDIPIEQKADLLLKANAEALKTPKVKFIFSGSVLRQG